MMVFEVARGKQYLLMTRRDGQMVTLLSRQRKSVIVCQFIESADFIVSCIVQDKNVVLSKPFLLHNMKSSQDDSSKNRSFLQLASISKLQYLIQMQEILQTGQYFNRQLITNNRLCAGALFYIQVAMIFLFGFFVRPAAHTQSTIQVADMLSVTAVAMLTLIAFPLIFSPAKNYLWSSIGFIFFITVLTFQLYPLVVTFWRNSQVSPFNPGYLWNQKITIYLSSRNVLTEQTTAVGAFKAALANSVAFAAIMGRVGVLEALIVSFIGTWVYELNRQLIMRYALDFGGSIGIFCFGGFYGASISVISYCYKHKRTAQEHEVRVAGKFSYTLVGVGALFCWILFPFLSTDIPASLIYYNQAAISTFYCISACVLTCVGLSNLITGQLDLKDFLYSPVVGGVIVGSSAGYINNSGGAIIMGIIGGVLHVFLQRWENKIKWYFLIENNVLFIFGIQGMVGGFLSAIFNKIALDHNSSAYPTVAPYILPSQSGQLSATGFTIAIAIATGLFVGIVINMLTKEVPSDHYHDRAYWITQQDCLSYTEDINMPSEQEKSDSDEGSEKEVSVYKEVIMHHEKGFKDKFVEL